MKHILIFFFVILSQSTFCQTDKLNQRQEYMKKHHLFVVNIELRNRTITKDGALLDTSINSHLKICLNKFWNLSDTIIYINKSDISKYKKDFPEHIFLDFMYKTNKISVCAFNLYLPNDKDFFNDICFRIIDDHTTKIDVFEWIRLLKCNVIRGNVFYAGSEIAKRFLILDEPALSSYQQEFIDELKIRYPNSFDIVKREFIEKMILEENRYYIYVNRLDVINIEDGTLVRL